MIFLMLKYITGIVLASILWCKAYISKDELNFKSLNYFIVANLILSILYIWR